MLSQLKDLAKAADTESVGILKSADGADSWAFNLKPHGSNGYEWLLIGREFTLQVGNWMRPKSRPSVMAEIRSESLWHLGPGAAATRITSLLDAQGGKVLAVKVSRADLCADVLLPSSSWSAAVENHFITRAVKSAAYKCHRKFTGIGIGSGMISARLYDKPLEIVMKSHKEWMYDVWQLPAVPDGHRIIRVEFQPRREGLKELGVDTMADLMSMGGPLWAYCSREWLKLQDDPGKHHTQQQTLQWWRVVQDGFAGAQGAVPCVRAKAIAADSRQLLNQMFGQLTSLAALYNPNVLETGEMVEVSACVERIRRSAASEGIDDVALTERVRQKVAKFQRAVIKFRTATRAREQNAVTSSIQQNGDGEGASNTGKIP